MTNYIICYNKKNLTYTGLWIGDKCPLIIDPNIHFIQQLEINDRSLTKELGLRNDLMFQEIVSHLVINKIQNKYENFELYNLNNQKDIQKYTKILDTEKRKGLSKVFRGDFSIIYNGNIMVYDIKNYTYINPNRMKPSEKIRGDIDTYSKTVDSNLVGLFMQPEVPLLLELTPDEFYSNENLQKTISINNFLQILKLIEFGPAIFKNNFDFKCFIKYNERDQWLELMSIDFSKIKEIQTDIVVNKINENGYIYIQFFTNDKLIYEISMRGNKKPNCAFINKNYTKNVINKDTDGLEFLEHNLIRNTFKIISQQEIPKSA